MTKINLHFIQIGVTHYNSIAALKARQKYGMAGYGIYIILLQILATAPERRLHILDIPQLVFQLNVKEEVIKDIITICFQLTPENYFTSNEVEETFTSLIKKVANLNPSAAGKASAEAKKAKKLLDKVNNLPIDFSDSSDSTDLPDSQSHTSDSSDS